MKEWIKVNDKLPETKQGTSYGVRQSEMVDIKFMNGKEGEGKLRIGTFISQWFTRLEDEDNLKMRRHYFGDYIVEFWKYKDD